MSQTQHITENEEGSPEFRVRAAEDERPVPFMTLASQWFAGLLTIEEKRRIETDQRLARFLQQT